MPSAVVQREVTVAFTVERRRERDGARTETVGPDDAEFWRHAASRTFRGCCPYCGAPVKASWIAAGDDRLCECPRCGRSSYHPDGDR